MYFEKITFVLYPPGAEGLDIFPSKLCVKEFALDGVTFRVGLMDPTFRCNACVRLIVFTNWSPSFEKDCLPFVRNDERFMKCDSF